MSWKPRQEMKANLAVSVLYLSSSAAILDLIIGLRLSYRPQIAALTCSASALD